MKIGTAKEPTLNTRILIPSVTGSITKTAESYVPHTGLQQFDQQLLVLFKRKLEYDYRINEYELYIVCLSLSIKL